MPSITDISPEFLRQRHRFTSRQVNLLFGYQVSEERIEEKTGILELTGELLRILDAFLLAGVQCIPLKGPVLSYRLYGDPTVRQSSDLDILVDVASVQEAINVVEGLGYHPESNKWPQREYQQKRLIRYGHHLNFIYPINQSRVELHWRMINALAISNKTFGTIVAENLTRIDFFGREVVVMIDETELLYLVIHGGHHQWFWLKWLADVNQYLRSHSIKQDVFLELTASMKAGRLVALCNALLAEYFPGDPLLPYSSQVPEFMLKYSRKRIAGDGVSGHDSRWTRMQNLYFLMSAYPGFTFKIRPVTHILGRRVLYGRVCRLCSFKTRKAHSES